MASASGIPVSERVHECEHACMHMSVSVWLVASAASVQGPSGRQHAGRFQVCAVEVTPSPLEVSGSLPLLVDSFLGFQAPQADRDS